MGNQPEPPDHHIYRSVSLNNDTLHFYLESIKFYESLLKEDITAIENDKDLAFLLSEREKEYLQIYGELRWATHAREEIERKIEDEGPDSWDYHMSFSHGEMRFLKSVSLLYLQHLRNRRNILASKQRISKHALMTIDQKISYYEEKTNLGILNTATARPLLVSELASEAEYVEPPETADVAARRLRPMLIDSIEILDPELRSRCLDLFYSFRQDGQHDRLDTVVNEATRILEEALRSASGASADCVGVSLATFAFGGEAPRLVVSELQAEQDAAHLLFRGVFGFIRNHVHHQLVKNLSPERVLQIVGMIDYLIFLVQDAKRQQSENENDG